VCVCVCVCVVCVCVCVCVCVVCVCVCVSVCAPLAHSPMLRLRQSTRCDQDPIHEMRRVTHLGVIVMCVHMCCCRFCNSGQGCFWFSQGCTIGCKACDGCGARIPKWDHCPLDSIKPTVNDPKCVGALHAP
jgi:hypothetical protein